MGLDSFFRSILSIPLSPLSPSPPLPLPLCLSHRYPVEDNQCGRRYSSTCSTKQPLQPNKIQSIKSVTPHPIINFTTLTSIYQVGQRELNITHHPSPNQFVEPIKSKVVNCYLSVYCCCLPAFCLCFSFCTSTTSFSSVLPHSSNIINLVIWTRIYSHKAACLLLILTGGSTVHIDPPTICQVLFLHQGHSDGKSVTKSGTQYYK